MIIQIRGLKGLAHIGVPDSEQRHRQELRVDLEFEYDARRAATGDEWPAAVDYKALSDAVLELVEGTRLKLIEAMADRIAARVMEDPRVLRVRVELSKPAALSRAETVRAVTSRERPLNEVVVALGSNIEPERHVERALELLRNELQVLRESPLVRTRPREFTEQPDFLNGALLARTPLDRAALKQRLLEIEAELGRVRTGNRAGPRTIDLDIVVWNGKVVDDHVHRWDFLRLSVAALLPDLDLSPPG